MTLLIAPNRSNADEQANLGYDELSARLIYVEKVRAHVCIAASFDPLSNETQTGPAVLPPMSGETTFGSLCAEEYAHGSGPRVAILLSPRNGISLHGRQSDQSSDRQNSRGLGRLLCGQGFAGQTSPARAEEPRSMGFSTGFCFTSCLTRSSKRPSIGTLDGGRLC